MLQCAGPGIDLPESVIECRYEVLRKPLGFSIDAARLSDDGDAIHAWVVLDGQVVSVGRTSHLGRRWKSGPAGFRSDAPSVPSIGE